VNTGGGAIGPTPAGLVIGPIIGGIASLFKKKKKPPFNPFIDPQRVVQQRINVERIQGEIETRTAEGKSLSRQENALREANETIRRVEARIQSRMAQFPLAFAQVGIPLNATVADLVRFTAARGGSQTQVTDFSIPEIQQLLFEIRSRPLPPRVPTGIPGRTVGPAPAPGARAGSRPAPPPPPPAPSIDRNIILALLLKMLAAMQPKQKEREMGFFIQQGFGGSPGSLDFGGFGGVVQSGLNLATQILGGGQQRMPTGIAGPVSFPGNQLLPSIIPAVIRSLPAVGAGAAGAGVAEFFGDLFSSGGASSGSSMAAFSDPIPGHCHPKAHAKVNPCTGKETWFTPRGTPLLFSGDLAAVRRVDRVAKRVAKSLPRKACRKR